MPAPISHIDPTTQVLVNSLSDLAHRQAAHAYNIANSSTPGFKPIVFSEELENAKLRKGLESDPKTLHIEAEEASFASSHHVVISKVLRSRYQMLRTVITSGKN